MDTDQKYLLKIAEKSTERQLEQVERARASRQPRFTKTSPDEFFYSTYNWLNMGVEAPPYILDSRTRDKWLRLFWPNEPHLAGVLNSACLIDSNRGFSIVGGRNQVKRYIDISHNLEGGKGWRFYHRKGALSFRTADIGFVSEIGTDGRGGPMRMLWNVDPTRCRLTGDAQTPLKYYPPRAKMQEWKEDYFFRINSMPSTDETLYDLGYCGVSRAIEIAKTMIAVYQHDHEQLGARAPRGLLLLKNVSESMWTQAMATRDEQLDSYERMYYGGVAVLASSGLDDIDAKLVALSNLPKDFDRKVFTDLLMFAYALIFGYSPDEFWPVQGGSFGRSAEAQNQYRGSTSKGILDYPNEFKENYQRLLPDTIQFEFDQRDDEGELRATEVQQAKVNVIKSIYEAGIAQGMPMIDTWQAQYLLAEAGIIPQEWTQTEEKIVADDETAFKDDEERKVYWSRQDRVIRAAEQFPNEPIVWYRERAGRGSTITLWENAKEMARFTPQRHRRGRIIKRQTEDTSEIIYKNDAVTITVNDVDRAITDGGKNIGNDWLEAVTNEPMTKDEIEQNPVE